MPVCILVIQNDGNHNSSLKMSLKAFMYWVTVCTMLTWYTISKLSKRNHVNGYRLLYNSTYMFQFSCSLLLCTCTWFLIHLPILTLKNKGQGGNTTAFSVHFSVITKECYMTRSFRAQLCHLQLLCSSKHTLFAYLCLS